MADEIRKLNRRLYNVETQLRRAGGTPQLSRSSLEDGTIREYDETGAPVSSYGKQHDGTHTVVVLNGPNPAAPTAPTMTISPGVAAARWNGKFKDDAFSPMDLSHVAVYVGLTSEEALLLSAQKATITGELGDQAAMPMAPGDYFAVLRSWSKAGKFSDPSPVVPFTIAPLFDPGEINTSIEEIKSDLLEQAEAAENAQAAADAASGAAGSAQSAADAAQAAADAAATAASNAAGVAAAKSKVLIQSTAPGAGDRNTNTLWIDTTGGANTPKRWTAGTTWVAVTDKAATDAAAAAAAAATAANNAATAAQAAQDVAENALADAGTANTAATAANSAAQAAAGLAGAKGRTIFQASAPTGSEADTKNLWIRTSDNKPHIYNGTDWVAVTDKAATDAATAAAAANSLASSKVTTFYGSSATATATGDLWLDSGNGNALKRWSGSAWVAVSDAKLQQALTAAGDAQATADGKIRTFAQVSAPTGLVASDAGDLWVDTDDGNKMWRWSGSAWVAVQDSSIATAKSAADAAASAAAAAAGVAAGKGKVLIQSTAPGVDDRNAVTLWIDTTGGANTPKRWSTGTTWVAVTDKAATDAANAAAAAATAAGNAASAAAAAQAKADEAFAEATAAATAAGNAQTAANGRSRNWFQASPPAGTAHRLDDTWFDLDDGNKIYSWDGTAWLPKQAGTNFFEDLAITNAKIGGVDAGKINAGFLDVANRIDAGSIFTDKMVITSTDNLVVDALNEFPVLWNGFNTASHPGAGWATDKLFGGAVASQKIPPKTAQSNMSVYGNSLKRRISVKPGDWYSLNSMVLSTAAGGTGHISVSQQAIFYDVAGVQLAGGPGNIVGGAIPTADWVANVWTEVGNKPVQVPAGAAFLSPVLTVYYSASAPVTAATWYIGPVSVTRAVSGKLVVDGSIDGHTITGALFRTSKTANRGIEINGLGTNNWFKAWDAVGNETFFLNGSNGELNMVGKYSNGMFGEVINIQAPTTETSYKVSSIEFRNTESLAAGDSNYGHIRAASSRNTGTVSEERSLSMTSTGATSSGGVPVAQAETYALQKTNGDRRANAQLYARTYDIWSGPSASIDVTAYKIAGVFSTEITMNSSNLKMTDVQMTLPRLRLTSSGDASASSTSHAFQVGTDDGLNIIIDENEILARNAGALAAVYFEGGLTLGTQGTSAGHATRKDYCDGQFYASSTSITPSSGNTPTSKSVSFPAGRFSSAPIVQVTPASAAPGTLVTGVGVTDVSTSGCTLWVTRTNTTATTLNFTAFKGG